MSEEKLMNEIFGKGAWTSTRLPGGRGSRDDVLRRLSRRGSGLSLAFLDPKERLDRDDVRDKLRTL